MLAARSFRTPGPCSVDVIYGIYARMDIYAEP